jgi:microcystin-dependent protein
MTQVVRQDDVYQTMHRTDDRLGALERSDDVPVGAIIMYGGSEAPPGYLLCNGAQVSRTEFASLFGTIGTRFGVGDGSTTFNVPDLQNRFPLGLASGDAPGSAIAQTGGAIDHELDTKELPAHNHAATEVAHTHTATQAAHTHGTPGASFAVSNASAGYIATAGSGQFNVSNYVAATDSQTPAITVNNNTPPAITVYNTGGGMAHNNMPPYITLNFIIATGIRE